MFNKILTVFTYGKFSFFKKNLKNKEFKNIKKNFPEKLPTSSFSVFVGRTVLRICLVKY